MTPNDRELSLYAKIEKLETENKDLKLSLADRSEKYKQFMDSGLDQCMLEKKKLEKALAIAKHCLKDIAQCTDENGVSVEQTMAQNALEKIEKELG